MHKPNHEIGRLSRFLRHPLKSAVDLFRKSSEDKDKPTLTRKQQLTVDETMARILLPRAWFTRTGPGVRDAAKKAFFDDMTDGQRDAAIRRGWVPARWQGMNQVDTDAATRSLPSKRKPSKREAKR